MFERLTFLSGRSPVWDEGDIKHAIQKWLRLKTASDQVLCLAVSKKAITIRVGNAALAQEVRLLDYDLRAYLEKECSYSFEKLKVTQR